MNECQEGLSLEMIYRYMPDERMMSKQQLHEHIRRLGCSISCQYIAYNPL
jgi:hypothetical protein